MACGLPGVPSRSDKKNYTTLHPPSPIWEVPLSWGFSRPSHPDSRRTRTVNRATTVAVAAALSGRSFVRRCSRVAAGHLSRSGWPCLWPVGVVSLRGPARAWCRGPVPVAAGTGSAAGRGGPGRARRRGRGSRVPGGGGPEEPPGTAARGAERQTAPHGRASTTRTAGPLHTSHRTTPTPAGRPHPPAPRGTPTGRAHRRIAPKVRCTTGPSRTPTTRAAAGAPPPGPSTGLATERRRAACPAWAA